MIGSILISFHCAFIVVRQDVSADRFTQGIERLRSICRAAGLRPFVLTPAMFGLYMKWCQPQLYLDLLEYRHVVFGEDPMMSAPRPNAMDLERAQLDQLLNAMLAPAVVAAWADDFVVDEWAVLAWRSLFLTLLMDTGTVHSHDDAKASCRERYPSLCAQIEAISKRRDKTAAHAFLRDQARALDERAAGYSPGSSVSQTEHHQHA